MRKLHLSIISLGLCLILGFGNLAAQKGKKEEPQTTFAVSVVAGDGDPSSGEWLLTQDGCEGEAEGSHLDANFPLLDCDPVVADSELKLQQISLSITRKSVRLHIFFRNPSGDHLQTDDIVLLPGAVENVSYTAFGVVVNSKDVPIRTAFDVVVNTIDVPIRQEGQGKPGSGPEIAKINVGIVRYIGQ